MSRSSKDADHTIHPFTTTRCGNNFFTVSRRPAVAEHGPAGEVGDRRSPSPAPSPRARRRDGQIHALEGTDPEYKAARVWTETRGTREKPTDVKQGSSEPVGSMQSAPRPRVGGSGET